MERSVMPQFRIEKTISESSTTRVYRAYQIALARRVLLKVLRPHLANDPAVRERFVREAHACAQLRSEYIVQVYDLTEFEDSPAIVMEFVNGHSLKELLSHQPLDRLSLAQRTAIHVLQGLSTAHRNGITHRDIKPGNILVTEEGTVKVTDFGLAHIADSTLVTAEGVVVGTPAYMAPEQVRGDRIDARTDLFSLGVTLVEVLTGERIFEGETYAECIRKILAFNPEGLNRFADRVPKEFLEFLKRLLQPKPEMRFASATEALAELHVRKEGHALPTTKKSPILNRRALVVVFTGILILVSIAVLLVVRSHTDTIPISQSNSVQSHDSAASVPAKPALSESARDSLQVNRQPQSLRLSDRQQRHTLPVSPTNTADSARVRFTCTPWAKVYLDGRAIGETPFAQVVSVSSGKHSVTFSNPSFDPIVRLIEARADSVLVVTANFLENAGFLRCIVQPWADVYVDEQYKDTTPLSKPIVLSAGHHQIRFHNSSSKDVVREVTIPAGDTLNLTISLR
jgi:serine/threonine protein kinase